MTNPEQTLLMRVSMREADDETHMECRFMDGQKFAAVTVNDILPECVCSEIFDVLARHASKNVSSRSSPSQDIIRRLKDVSGFIHKEFGRTEAAACLATEAAEEIERLSASLQAIIDRSNTGEPGTSKVIDMRKIAEKALSG